MKKIIVLLSFIGLFSCSDDNEIRNENVTENNVENSIRGNNNINDDIDRMFYEYVNSTEYHEFNMALKSFYQKLNVDKSDVEFDIERVEVMEWVELNLDVTEFTNLERANQEWQQVVNLKDVELKKFPQILDFIVKNTEQKVLPYITKWLNPNHNSTNDVDCDEQFDICNITADMRFISNIRAFSNDPNGIEKADMIYMDNLWFCARQFNSCIGLNV